MSDDIVSLEEPYKINVLQVNLSAGRGRSLAESCTFGPAGARYCEAVPIRGRQTPRLVARRPTGLLINRSAAVNTHIEMCDIWPRILAESVLGLADRTKLAALRGNTECRTN